MKKNIFPVYRARLNSRNYSINNNNKKEKEKGDYGLYEKYYYILLRIYLTRHVRFGKKG